jgi:prophage regulatory protein
MNVMESQNHKAKERILRLEDVKERTGLSRSTIYLNVNKGTFPSPINLGARCIGWLESELDAWIAARTQISRSQANTS